MVLSRVCARAVLLGFCGLDEARRSGSLTILPYRRLDWLSASRTRWCLARGLRPRASLTDVVVPDCGSWARCQKPLLVPVLLVFIFIVLLLFSCCFCCRCTKRKDSRPFKGTSAQDESHPPAPRSRRLTEARSTRDRSAAHTGWVRHCRRRGWAGREVRWPPTARPHCRRSSGHRGPPSCRAGHRGGARPRR